MRKAESTIVIIQKSQSQGSSLLGQKMDPIRAKKSKKKISENCAYLTGLLFQGLQIFRIRRSYSYKNLPQTTENQKVMLWINKWFISVLFSGIKIMNYFDAVLFVRTIIRICWILVKIRTKKNAWYHVSSTKYTKLCP